MGGDALKSVPAHSTDTCSFFIYPQVISQLVYFRQRKYNRYLDVLCDYITRSGEKLANHGQNGRVPLFCRAD